MTATALLLQAIVISLRRSLDRRAKVESELQKISLPWSFLDAVDGTELQNPPNEYKALKVKCLQGYELTPNEIGCYLSHKEAWRRCVEKNIPTLIFEDDFILAPEFGHTILALLNRPSDWNFVRLQGLYDVPYQELLLIDGVHLVKNIGDAVGAAAYLLKPEIARTLITESFDIYEPVDHFLEHQKKHGLEFLAVHPYPVDITRAKSTIDDRHERAPVQGMRKRLRSVARALDRVFSKRPWFPR
ncbi:MAG: glycosyltransferase family 25 protein [Akkermansiaceae bacterium]|jgi:glycosyl transferase family 25|nr:glycosyltransferase family 25 protein [Akkermansiaceae bacterium]